MSKFLIQHTTGDPEHSDALESFIVVKNSTALSGIQIQRGQVIQTLAATQEGLYWLCTMEGSPIQELQGVTRGQLLLYCEESDC